MGTESRTTCTRNAYFFLKILDRRSPNHIMDFIDTFSNVVTTRLIAWSRNHNTTLEVRYRTQITLVWSIFNALPQPIGQ